MQTITLKVNDSINKKFLNLLQNFLKEEISVLECYEYISDDDYLRKTKGMVQSIHEARNESIENRSYIKQVK